MTSAVATNITNNIEQMLSTNTKNSEMSNTDFSAVLEDKTCGTIGDMRNNSSVEENDNVADFKEYLEQVTGEVNMENSLNLTLAKDVAVDENANAGDEKDTAEENNLLLFAQVFDTTQQATVDLDTSADATLSIDLNLSAKIESEVESNIDTTMELLELADAETEVKTQEEDEIQNKTELDEDMLQDLNIESIETETSSNSSNDGSSFFNQQSPEEHGIKIALNNEGLNEVKTFDLQSAKNASTVKPTEVTPSKIIEQVSKQLESLQNTSKVNIVLNPESLGKVTIQLVKSPDGLSAQFTTATQEARNLLMQGLDSLKDTLTAHGVGVDNVSVKVNDAQKSEYNADWTEQEGFRGGNKEQGRQDREEKEKGLFEKTMEEKVTK